MADSTVVALCSNVCAKIYKNVDIIAIFKKFFEKYFNKKY